jgi:hypothetical protein
MLGCREVAVPEFVVASLTCDWRGAVVQGGVRLVVDEGP